MKYEGVSTSDPVTVNVDVNRPIRYVHAGSINECSDRLHRIDFLDANGSQIAKY